MSGAPTTGPAGRRLLAIAGVVVAGTVVAAVFLMDSPARQRAERLDAIRVADLRRLEERIDTHADVHGRLPERLAVVDGTPGSAIVDPTTGRPYQYEVTGERTYRLCATFQTATDAPRESIPVYDTWRHDEGRQCFQRKVADAD